MKKKPLLELVMQRIVAAVAITVVFAMLSLENSMQFMQIAIDRFKNYWYNQLME
jgi:hypothetical protein